MNLLTLPAVPGLAQHGTPVRLKVVEIAAKHGWDAPGMVAAISHESGWNPAAVNPGNGASGIIQWTRETAPLYGTTVEQIRRMPVEDQLDLAERYWSAASAGRPIGPLDWLVLGLGTGNVAGGYRADLPDSTILYAAGSRGALGNPGLQDAAGNVTVGTARAALRRVLSDVGELPVVSELGEEGTRIAKAAAGAEVAFWLTMGAMAVAKLAGGKKGRRRRYQGRRR